MYTAKREREKQLAEHIGNEMRVGKDTYLWQGPSEGNTAAMSTQHQYDTYHQYVSPAVDPHQYDAYHQYASPASNYSGTSQYFTDPHHAASHPFITSQGHYPSPPQHYYDAPQSEPIPMGRDYTNTPDHTYRRRLVAVERYYEIDTRPVRVTKDTTEKPRLMSPNEVHNRLYSLSSAKQEAGRQKREEIARKCKGRSFVPISKRISSVDAIELTDRLYSERRNKYREIHEEVIKEPSTIECGDEQQEGHEVIQFCLEEPDEFRRPFRQGGPDHDGIFEY